MWRILVAFQRSWTLHVINHEIVSPWSPQCSSVSSTSPSCISCYVWNDRRFFFIVGSYVTYSDVISWSVVYSTTADRVVRVLFLAWHCVIFLTTCMTSLMDCVTVRPFPLNSKCWWWRRRWRRWWWRWYELKAACRPAVIDHFLVALTLSVLVTITKT